MLAEAKVTAMLQLYKPVEQAGITSLHLSIEDGHHIADQAFDDATAFVRAQHSAGACLLIACGAGISRSSTFAVLALNVIEGLTLEQAFWQVRKANPRAMPDQIHWEALAKYRDDDQSFWELWRRAEL